MLICRVPEEGAGRGEPADSCQTASELFELMTKDHDFEAGDDALTTGDLVLLYKNIDLGNQLMSNVRGRPNQRVETIYHDDPETDSDLSESCSSEELRNIMLANKERIDLFTNSSPLNSLCHKLGDLEIQVSNISTNLHNDCYFLNKDPQAREQLKSLQLMSQTSELNNLLPTSLLDFLCSRRLDDNYNFYMDNVITHVKHTIDQLKRISNGDYLPQKVKEKWRELDQNSIQNGSKVLTTSISMPLQVKPKYGLTADWDNVIHTEVDLRSLVKLMEKKIVLRVPRMISGPYKIFNRSLADKLVISCSRRRRPRERSQEPRLDAVVSIQCAKSGQLISNIHSIMLPQPEHQSVDNDCTKMIPLEYPEHPEAAENTGHADTRTHKVIELTETEQIIADEPDNLSIKSDEYGSLCSLSDAADSKDGDLKYDTDSLSSVPRPGSPHSVEQILTTAPARVFCAEASSNHATPNDLNFTIATLERQATASEESTSNSFYIVPKKNSPERARIKSPYENKSYILAEKKRKKLLELKEKRERRQIASNEHNKVTKSKDFPQKVSSVTKLSITNKSFYNSIYGRNPNSENTKRVSVTTINNLKARQGTQRIDEELEESDADVERKKALKDKSQNKITRDNFLEDTETEMSYLKSKQDSDFIQVSTTSVVSNDSTTNLYPLSTDYCTSLTSFNTSRQESSSPLEKHSMEHELNALKALKNKATSYKVDNDKAPAVECRRSLDKIYTLIKKLQRIEISETEKKKALASESRELISDSRSNLKRRVSFSNPRTVKNIKDESNKEKERSEDLPTAAVPKVLISAKPQTGKANDKSRNKTKPRIKTIDENPLRAISQLLHEFDTVQKSRPKIADPKSINRSISTDNADLDVKVQKRRARIELPVKVDPKVAPKVKSGFVRETEVKPQVLERKINELIDEAKEARGEAVRGPPRFSSRLNELAQPKRTYVKALADALPKRQTAARPQRPTSQPRMRRRDDARLAPGPVGAPHSSLERAPISRRSSVSPARRARAGLQQNTLAAADALHTLEKKVAVELSGRRSARRTLSPRALELPCDIIISASSSETESVQCSSIDLKLHQMTSAMLRAELPRPLHEVQRESSSSFVATACVAEGEGDPVEETRQVTFKIEDFFSENTNEIADTCERSKHDVTPVNSVTELQKLEHALHRSLSSGAFAGRLRVNKLTLSPRPSLQRVVMHESGDTTQVLKSNLSEKIQLTCQSDSQKMDLMGILSTTGLNCSFIPFPLQIYTVNYAFPAFGCQINQNPPSILDRDMRATSDAGISCAISEERTLASTVMDDAEEKSGNGLSGKECVIIHACASDKNQENETSTDSSVTACKDNKEVTASVDKENCPPSDYNTSFDILVGLLNEIQKITTCGSEAASSRIQKSIASESSSEKEPANMPSISSVAVSNYYVGSDAKVGTAIPEMNSVSGTAIPEMNSVSAEAIDLKPLCEDKEVLARVTLGYAAASTSQQAQLPIGIATSTCTNLPTSSCSVSAFTDSEYCDMGCNTLIHSGDKITNQMGIKTNSVKSLVPYYNNIFKVDMKKDATVSCRNSVATETNKNVTAVCKILVDIAPVQKSKRFLNLHGEIKNDKKEGNKLCQNVVEFDSTLKVKRDVLVTFYSILVLTVFAALALPEMLQYA